MDSPPALNDRGPQFELVEPLAGPSIHANWLAERGEGFHHLGYVVDSVERVTGEMEAAGHPAIARIHSFGASGDVRPPTTTPPTRSASSSRRSSPRPECPRRPSSLRR
jgi:glyoxalase/bleomycin resistance protein/dioxygenase superfamily protein